MREALGIPGNVNTQADLSSLYNTSFAGDRERNMMVVSFSSSKSFFILLTKLFSPAPAIYFLDGLEYHLLKLKLS